MIVIAGASGLIGTALSEKLTSSGYNVVRLVRRKARTDAESEWNPQTGRIDGELIKSATAVVNLAGASIGDKRLTAKYRQTVLQSRLDATGLIARTLAAGGGGKLVQGSAMGYYGHRPHEKLTEDLPPGSTFLSQIVTAWEAAAAPALEAGIPVAFSRTGLVLAPHGGFAARLLPLVRRGLIRSLGPGDAIHSWISLPDVVAALHHLIVSELTGPVNVISPNPISNRELIRAISAAFGKKPGLPIPSPLMKLAIGPAVVDLLTSQDGAATRLSESGFQWSHENITQAAAYVAGRQ